MARVHVVLCTVQGHALGGSTVMPCPGSVESGADTVTSSGTSAQSSLTGELGQFWSVTADGGAVFVKAGSNPTAITDAGWLILDGQTRELAVSAASEKLAIIDA